MSSCYKSYEVLLTSFLRPNFFQKFALRKMYLFRRSSSKKNAKGVTDESSAGDINTPWWTEVRPCEWLHVAFMEEAGFPQELAQHIANAGLTNFLADECDQHKTLTNFFVQIFYFLSRLEPPALRFNLYSETCQILLTEFCEICLIPSDGELREPKPTEFEDFRLTLTEGEGRGVSKATSTSL